MFSNCKKYSDGELLGLKYRGNQLTNPIYVFLGDFHYTEFGIEVSFIRKEYIIDDKENVSCSYLIGEICEDGSERIIKEYDMVYYDEIYRCSVKVEKDDKKGIYNLYWGEEWRPCYDEEIYQRIDLIHYTCRSGHMVSNIIRLTNSNSVSEYDGKHNIIDWRTGKELLNKNFEHVIFLNERYILLMDLNKIQLVEQLNISNNIIEIGPEFETIKELIKYLLSLEKLYSERDLINVDEFGNEIDSEKIMYELIGKLYELI